MGGRGLQLPPIGLAEELLTFRRPVSVRRTTRCSKHVGSCPQSLWLPCAPQLERERCLEAHETWPSKASSPVHGPFRGLG